MRRVVVVAVCLLGVAAVGWLMPPRPRATFNPGGPVEVSSSGVAVVVRSLPPEPPPPPRRPGDPIFLPPPIWPSVLAGRGPVEAWDIATGRKLWAAHGPGEGIGAEPTADGTRVVLRMGRPGDHHAVTAELRDLVTGERLGTFPGDATFSPPDGRFALVRSPDPADPASNAGVLDLYETATGGWVRRLPEGPFPEFSGDGRRLLVPHYRYRGGRVYDTATGRLLTEFTEPRDPEWLGMDGRRLIDASGVVWDVDSHTGVGRVAAVAPGRMYGPDNGWVSPGGTWAATRLDGTDDAGRAFAEWSLLPTNEHRTWTPSAGFRVSSYSPDAGGRLVDVFVRRDRPAGPVARWVSRQHPALAEWGANRHDGHRVLLDPHTPAVVAELPDEASPRGLSADGRTLFVTAGGRVEVWDVPARRPWGWIGGLAAGWTVAVWFFGRRRHHVPHHPGG